jgi:hypothetical protein
MKCHLCDNDLNKDGTCTECRKRVAETIMQDGNVPRAAREMHVLHFWERLPKGRKHPKHKR